MHPSILLGCDDRVENIVLSNTIPAVESHIMQLKAPLMFWFLAVFYDAHCRKYFWGKQAINLSLNEFCLFKEAMTVLAAKAVPSATQKMELHEEKLHSKCVWKHLYIKPEFFISVCNKYSTSEYFFSNDRINKWMSTAWNLGVFPI